jgi:hypothetical protein
MRHALTIGPAMVLAIVMAFDWTTISLESAVKTSDIIVIGTLRNVSEETHDGIDYGTGEITVDEVLRGKARPGEKLVLKWQNESNVMCPRVEHEDDSNKQLIWLLTITRDQNVAADNPGRVAVLEKKQRVIELIRELP